VSADRTTVEVVAGDTEMCLHQELGYVPWSPDILWFFCKRAPSAAGETTVCDGAQFAQALHKTTMQCLLDKPILYDHRWPAESWRGFLMVETMAEAIEKLKRYPSQIEIKSRPEDEVLHFEYRTSAILQKRGVPTFLNSILNVTDTRHRGISDVRFADGSIIPEDVIFELRNVGTKCMQDIKWEDQYVVLIDNNMIMHGRRSFRGERVIYSRFGMIDKGQAYAQMVDHSVANHPAKLLEDGVEYISY
jgi:alpha-ketoglutarate-dependent taurine dioxygenase